MRHGRFLPSAARVDVLLLVSAFLAGCGAKKEDEPTPARSEYGEWEPKWVFEMPLYLHQAGSLRVADLDNDGQREVIFVAYTGVWGNTHPTLFVLRSDGSHYYPWPLTLGDDVAAAKLLVGDVAGDDNPEIVISYVQEYAGVLTQRVKVVSGAREVLAGWPMAFDRGVTLALGDADGDAKREILALTHEPVEEQRLFVVRGDGTLVEPFPKRLSDITGQTMGNPPHFISVADVDRDSDDDIVATLAGAVYAISLPEGELVSGFPTDAGQVDAHAALPVIIADLTRDGDPELIVQGLEGWGVFGANADPQAGSHTWSTRTGGVIVGAANLDGDNDLELCLQYEDKVEARDWTGDLRYQWPIDSAQPSVQAVVGDFDSDAEGELFVVERDAIKVLNANASTITRIEHRPGHRYSDLDTLIQADLDSNGKTDLVLLQYIHAHGGRLSVWELPRSSFRTAWPMPGHDGSSTFNFDSGLQ